MTFLLKLHPQPGGSCPPVELTGPFDWDQTTDEGMFEQQDAMAEDGNGCLKRGRDTNVDSIWITPIRMVISRPVPSESITVSNSFPFLVLSVNELLAET